MCKGVVTMFCRIKLVHAKSLVFSSFFFLACIGTSINAIAVEHAVTVGPVVNSNVQLIFVDSVSGTNVTTINVGDIVVWTWASDGHGVTSALQTTDPLYFNSGINNAGTVYKNEFDTPGTFAYTCVPHEGLGMLGTVIVMPVALQPVDYLVGVSSSIATIHAGQSATFIFSVTPSGGYSGTVNFACNEVPDFATCTFSPPTLNVSGSMATSTLTLTTTGASSALIMPHSEERKSFAFAFWGSLGLLGIVLVGGAQRRMNKTWHVRLLQMIGMVMFLLSLAGCGGSVKPSTQLGISQITVTASSSNGSISHAVTLYINVVQ